MSAVTADAPSSAQVRERELAAVVAAPLRADLVMQKQLFRGTEYYVIKDPLALTYFRLQHEEGFLITLLDGKRSIGEVHAEFRERFPNHDLTMHDVAGFVNQMSMAGLLNINAQRFVSVARAQESVRSSWIMMWGKLISGLLFMRFPLIDPSPWLGRLAHAIRFVWTRWFVGLSLAFVAWTAFWLILHREAFTQNTINFFSPGNLFLVWVTIILVKTTHEFGHATTCRHFGGEVHEMGVCLICFAPAGYVDASDSWMMRKKAHKLYTTMAGVFIEFVIASVSAYLWLYLPPGLTKNLAFNAMIVASVNTVFFNANPLMKFDGYYILSDVLEIPNLRTKAMTYCSYHIQRILLGYRNLLQERALGEERHNRAFIVYSVLAFAYMMTVIYSLTQVFARVLGPYGLHDFGLGIGIFVEGSFAMFPVVKVLSDAFSAGRANTIRDEPVARRIVKWLIPLVIVLVLLSRVPSHYTVHVQSVIVPMQTVRAGVAVGGVVETVHVRTGEWVNADQPLLTLRNEDVTLDSEAAQLQFESASVAYAGVQADRTLRGSAAGPRAALGLEVAATTRERARRDQKELVVRAPAAGVVTTPDITTLKGQYLGAGFGLLRVADMRRFKLLIPLTESQAELIEVGSQVRGRMIADGREVEAAITVRPTQKAGWEDYRPAMLSAFGGPAPFEMSSASSRTQPSFGLYIAEAEVSKPSSGLMDGLRVKVEVQGRAATYGQRVWRWLASLWRARTSA
jgi:putative peptide zinc metalloprotease protein